MKNAWNEVGFNLRSNVFGKLKFRRGFPSVLDVDPAEVEFYRRLISKCKEQLLNQRIARVWDVGAKNGSYLSLLASEFQNSILAAVEIDGKRRYVNGFLREDYLLARANDLRKLKRKVEVYLEDFQTVDIPVTLEPQLFFFLFPFVSEDPCLAWGLPKRFAKFEELLKKTRSQEGKRVILSTHQGEWERDDADRAYRLAGIHVRWSKFNPSEIPTNYPQRNEIFIACAE